MNEEKKIDSLSWTIGRIDGYAQMITNGVRDCAHMVIHKNHIDAIIESMKNERLYIKIFPLKELHHEIFLYRYKHLGKIIEYLQIENGEKQSAEFQHWCWGKLFGYSEKEIGKFLSKLPEDKATK